MHIQSIRVFPFWKALYGNVAKIARYDLKQYSSHFNAPFYSLNAKLPKNHCESSDTHGSHSVLNPDIFLREEIWQLQVGVGTTLGGSGEEFASLKHY